MKTVRPSGSWGSFSPATSDHTQTASLIAQPHPPGRRKLKGVPWSIAPSNSWCSMGWCESSHFEESTHWTTWGYRMVTSFTSSNFGVWFDLFWITELAIILRITQTRPITCNAYSGSTYYMSLVQISHPRFKRPRGDPRSKTQQLIWALLRTII